MIDWSKRIAEAATRSPTEVLDALHNPRVPDLDPIEKALGKHLIGLNAWRSVMGASLELGDVPPFPASITSEMLAEPCPFHRDSDLTVTDTHRLVLVPEKVDGIGLTVKHMCTSAKAAGEALSRPKMVLQMPFDHWIAQMSAKSEWVLLPMLTGPLAGALSYQAQLRVLEEYPHYRPATFLQMTVAMLMNDLVLAGDRQTQGPCRDFLVRCVDSFETDGRKVSPVIGCFNILGLSAQIQGWEASQLLGLAITRRL